MVTLPKMRSLPSILMELSGSLDEVDEVDDLTTSVGERDCDDIEAIIGPTEHAAAPWSLKELWVSESEAGKVRVRSNSRTISVADYLALLAVGGNSVPLSFGSLLHVNGRREHCRPCMFERSVGRCRKTWLCDFCHMHTGGNRNKKRTPTSKLAD
eukprot:TRINITY_DN67921_c0_g1_i1.p1 TRINITY_DN67921_c0_g1~~TRINITY_DN67921_c0_g1_i1.p1  ORF type:complete len:155 (-),score=10.14 TRINITY_DN67921_c0_g1_i1:150-614(-)